MDLALVGDSLYDPDDYFSLAHLKNWKQSWKIGNTLEKLGQESWEIIIKRSDQSSRVSKLI